MMIRRFRATLLLVAVPAIIGAWLAMSNLRSAEDRPADDPEKAVRAVLDEQQTAWNKGDLEGFMAGYWKSDDLRFFSGPDVTQGWQATLDRYKKKYQADGKEMGKLTFSEVDAVKLGPDAALVRGRWKLKMSKDEPGGLFTLVFRRTPDGWRIVHDHTSK
jgi:beta-aspartyl-peptidase (threonine type)